ncbi:MAG: GAF domain-containing protein [Methylobacter sp.]|nr:GAF domain-containing protein [Methylobacter sp.]MDP2098333.1 GAF domain-containing protein [Methylobacter sp.]MDP2430187.1 GAF domain-containing protein [Methylobacter sp.]MDP3056371.1 GAF domain-containing protein [Methylobacter sp.]MDP3362872.1 GAF domain-containing protein [Methylobacter sp.]
MSLEHDWQIHCEAEALAYSGAIQPHGGLIRLDSTLCVSHASSQLGAYLPYQLAALLGRPLPKELADVLAPSLAKLPAIPGSRSELLAVSLANEASLDIVITQGNDGIIIELMPHTDTLISASHYPVQMNTPYNSAQALLLHQEMAILFQQLTGFNRVMIYAFRDDGDGDVLAEALNGEVYGSYLGLRFPGSDIPHIARTLYLKNPWRLIPDSQAQPVPLLSHQQDAPDLTWSDLRSVSPVHQAYLHNMGVCASLSLPIVVARELWGLIACHHAEPRTLSLQVLRAASRNARQYSLAIAGWQAASRMRFMDSLSSRFKAMRMMLLRHGSILTATAEIAPILLEQLNACGLAIRFGDDWVDVGEIPAFTTLERLDDWFERDCPDVIYSSDSLMRMYPEAGDLPVAGVMALKLRTRSRDSLHLWLFRRELVQDVEWGGNPNKPVEYQDGALDIAPRRSFDKWAEKRKGYSLPWQNEDRIVTLHLRHMFMEIYG